METSLKTGFAQIFSCCPKNLSCPNFGGAAAPLAPPARTPMGGGAGKLKYHWERVLENLSFKGAFVLIIVTLISSILFWQSITW